MTADINSETQLPRTMRQTCRKRRGKHVKNEETGMSRRALGYADAGHDSGSTIWLKVFAERWHSLAQSRRKSTGIIVAMCSVLYLLIDHGVVPRIALLVFSIESGLGQEICYGEGTLCPPRFCYFSCHFFSRVRRRKRDSYTSISCLTWLLLDSSERTDLSSGTDHERADSAPGVAGASVSCHLFSLSAQFTGSQCSSS